MLESVTVETTARLHMGFFDLNGGLGRRFGSIGVSLDKPSTHLVAKLADTTTVIGHDAKRVHQLIEQLSAALNLSASVHVEVKQAIPSHAGLGSGTQLAIAVGMVLNTLFGSGLSVNEIAKLTMRGGRSGIGLGTFLQGGVIVDGGRGEHTVVPPVIAHVDFPEEWRILLMMDTGFQGVHGAAEVAAFKSLPQFPAQSAEKLCRHVLMQALPALAEADLVSFGQAIKQLQELTGDYFAPVQGGRYASATVASLLTWLESQGAVCVGQSSWGPTGFAIFADEVEAVQYLEKLKVAFHADCSGHEADLSFILCKGRNQGGIVRVSPK